MIEEVEVDVNLVGIWIMDSVKKSYGSIRCE